MARRVHLAFPAVCMVVLAFSASAEAQTGSVTGTVTNASTTAGVGDVSIYAYSTSEC